MQKLRQGPELHDQSQELAFATWLHTIERASQQAASAGKMSRALSHMINREMSRGWSAWYLMYAEQKRRMESMRRSMGHFLNRELSRGWGAWVEMAVERATFMQKLRKGLSFMINRKLAVGFATWSQTVHPRHSRSTVSCARLFPQPQRSRVAGSAQGPAGPGASASLGLEKKRCVMRPHLQRGWCAGLSSGRRRSASRCAAAWATF